MFSFNASISGVPIPVVYVFLYGMAVLLELRRTLPARILSFWIIFFVWIFFLFSESSALPAWTRLFFACVGSLWLLKVGARIQFHSDPATLPILRELFFRFCWPGMSSRGFLKVCSSDEGDGREFSDGYLCLLIGIVLFLIIAMRGEGYSDFWLGLIGLLPLFLMLHFGYAVMLRAGLRLSSIDVPRLFDAPLRSRSLREFWSRRWNLAFVEMNKALFYSLLTKHFGPRIAILLTFILSGFAHELGISFPAGGGYGLPTIYFFLHGLLYLLEDSLFVRRILENRVLAYCWVWGALLLPIPLLFHEAFLHTLIVPLYRTVGESLWAIPRERGLEFFLLLGAPAHLLVLCAGIQVPWRLNWREDLAKLSPFNRKIMWNYGAFIFLLILSFSVLSYFFYKDMQLGVPSALGIAALLAGFWSLRLLVDVFYFSSDDWPKGPQFVVGHTLLLTLFVFLAFPYIAVLVWHSF